MQEDIDSKTTYSNEWDILSKDTKFHPLRPIQKQVLDKVQEAIDEGYENIIVECPVGSGKSAIAKTIPQNYASPAYIVTHLKGLQAQYLKKCLTWLRLWEEETMTVCLTLNPEQTI